MVCVTMWAHVLINLLTRSLTFTLTSLQCLPQQYPIAGRALCGLDCLIDTKCHKNGHLCVFWGVGLLVCFRAGILSY